MKSQERRSRLATLLDFLSDEFSWEFDRDEFDDRFLLQKYVFFAQRLGFPLDYGYNVYVFGAYSPSLAQDYYSEEVPSLYHATETLEGFDSNAYTQLVRNRDSRWLEIASTILLYHDRFRHMPPQKRREKVIEKTRLEKDATRRSIQQIYETLADFGLLD